VVSVLVFVYFWPTEHRYEALGALAAIYGVIGLALLLMVRKSLVGDPPPFAGTLSELGRDAHLLDRVRDAAAEEAVLHARQREGGH
jgi:uncharacterized membrane protein YqjE